MSDFLGKPLLKLWNLAPLMRVSHSLHIDFMTTSWWEENSAFIKSKPCNAPLELEKRRLSQWSKHTQRKIPVLQILHQETTQGEEKKKMLDSKIYQVKEKHIPSSLTDQIFKCQLSWHEEWNKGL